MARKKFLLGMLALTLVFGLMVIACDPEADPALNGTWKQITGTDYYSTYVFNSGEFTMTRVAATGTRVEKGNYITSGGVLIMTSTSTTTGGVTFEIPPATQTSSYTVYSIKNGKLYLGVDGESGVYKKQ
jgi:hypothetical protein